MIRPAELALRIAEVLGAQHRVYLPGREGPFRCSRCIYYPEPNRCNNAQIKALAIAGKKGLRPEMITPEGLVEVEPDGCSDYFKRKAR